MSRRDRDENLGQGVIDSFCHEQSPLDYAESKIFEVFDTPFYAYRALIDCSEFNPESSITADFGAGSGRWGSRLLADCQKFMRQN